MEQHDKENGGGAMSMLAGTPSLRRGGCATPLAPAQITSSLDFGVDDEVTSMAVGCVLDSLDDIHCLLEAKVKTSFKSRYINFQQPGRNIGCRKRDRSTLIYFANK